MLVHRLRRCPNIDPTLGLVFAGLFLIELKSLDCSGFFDAIH